MDLLTAKSFLMALRVAADYTLLTERDDISDYIRHINYRDIAIILQNPIMENVIII